jgi:septum formation protein
MVQKPLSPDIVLASASPRRATLLRQIGLACRIHPSTLDEDGETPFEGESPDAFAVRLALAKAMEVAERLGQGLVIGADTVVICDERILGKPRDDAEARASLTLLAGRTHRVITGVAVVEAKTGRAEIGTASTSVRMRPYDAEEAARYVASGEPLDKAGAYGIQGRGALLVEEIQGDYFNVVGLPLVLLTGLLARFGISPWGAGKDD